MLGRAGGRQTETHAFEARRIENTIRKQKTAVLRALEPCSARKARRGHPFVEIKRLDLDRSRQTKARRGLAQRKSGLPDLRNHKNATIKKPISGKPEIGAHFVSFYFTNTSFR